MALGSSTAFYRDDSLDYLMNRHAISFQSGAVSSSSEMLPMGGYYSTGMMVPKNSSMVNIDSGIIQVGNSSGSSLLLDSVHGLKHDAGLTVEWSAEEQYKLDEGLEMFKDEPNIMKYIKIAATVRDVALRCRWMQRKRRKPEDHSVGKKAINWKLQDNIDLFCNARDNITAILNDMREMPEIMSHMPPLPVSINEDLANSTLPRASSSLLGTPQSMVFGSPRGIQLKHEPSC